MAKRSKFDPTSSPTLFEMSPLEETEKPTNEVAKSRPYDLPNIYLGTSSFTADGWAGKFYPKGLKTTDYLTHYSKIFRCVEIDSTFYATPAATAVNSWRRKTPADFVFAAKVPKIITHEKVLKDCDAEFQEFRERMSLLNEKLGPMLFQFPLFSKYEFKTGEDFLQRLRSFLAKLPQSPVHQFAVEIRNQGWLDERFLDTLREHSVALALTDASFVARPWESRKPLDWITSDFLYVRWLGHRKQIETITTTWDQVVLDRTGDLKTWVSFLRNMVLDKRLRKLFAFANNHYAGFAPATIQQFYELWKDK